MIDMVFLLLVFFMTVSTLARAERSHPVELPESHESTVPDDRTDRGVVTVNASGLLFSGTVQTSIAELEDAVRREVAANPEFRVQVRADRSTPFREVRKVLEACSRAGAYRVIYATHEAR